MTAFLLQLLGSSSGLQQQNHQNKVEAAEKSDSIAISFCIQHYLFCSWSLASVTSSPGVVAYTALKLRLYSFQLQNNSVLHTSAASETITSYMVHFCNSLTKMAASCWTDLSVVSRGRGRDRECRHSPNVVTNNFNFNQTLFGS